MNIKNLSVQQKKILRISGIVLFSLFLFIFLIFVPQRKKLADIKNKLARAEAKIAQISALTKNQDLGTAMKLLNQQFIDASARLPQQEESALSFLADNARKHKIEVKNISLGEGAFIKNKIPMGGLEIIPVNMSLQCDYRSLGEFLNVLDSDKSILVKVKKLEIRSKAAGDPQLDINLQLAAYLLRK